MGEREDKSGRELEPWSKFEEEGREKRPKERPLGGSGKVEGPVHEPPQDSGSYCAVEIMSTPVLIFRSNNATPIHQVMLQV